MLQKIKNVILNAGVFSLLAIPVLAPATAFADNAVANGACNGTDVASTTSTPITISGNGSNTFACPTDTTGQNGFTNLLRLVINIFSVIVGFIAVVMIIYGGVKYITSGGDSNNISAAKNTILYAIIGLVIVALAQLIVHFVLAKAGTINTAG